jgi:hypothetical protein
MSCWVVPTVAAELWGCTVDAVMAGVRNGDYATREEAGWTFIDVAPDSPTMESPKASLKMMQPAEMVSAAEMDALGVGTGIAATAESQTEAIEISDSFDFREARKLVESTRRAPMAEAA